MHTLSLFPNLLTFGLLAPFLIRISVGLFLLSLSWDRYHKPYRWTTLLYFVFGTLIILGLYTQLIAILAIGILKFDFYVDFWKNRKVISIGKDKYFLYGIAGIVLLSLLVTGPGFWAFDLPL